MPIPKFQGVLHLQCQRHDVGGFPLAEGAIALIALGILAGPGRVAADKLHRACKKTFDKKQWKREQEVSKGETIIVTAHPETVSVIP
jgi:hypothetical protein